MKKRGVLQLALQLNFWIKKDTCNSPYIWCNSLQFIAFQLQLNKKNSFSTNIQLHYNYTHDVMFMSLIIIHLLKFDT
jgi:hypothetical protein